MMLLPPPEGTCPICAVDHLPDDPHNQQSLYWQYRFLHEHGRWPTWADAIAHCDDAKRAGWKKALEDLGHWTAPEGDPIPMPPAGAERKPVGDIGSLGFGPYAGEHVSKKAARKPSRRKGSGE